MNTKGPSRRLSPRERYHTDLRSGLIFQDDAQQKAVARFARLFDELTASHGRVRGGFFDRVLQRGAAEWRAVHGLYLWGEVGRGKTYIVDAFFDSLPFAEKKRLHFHSFMRRTHDALRGSVNEVEPLVRVATIWAKEHRVLCLDEFHVSDITDAMLLAKLLEVLFAAGVTLVVTSNERPEDLYMGGLQRERFLPAIQSIKRNLEVFQLTGEVDYRLRALERAPVYYQCAPGEADGLMDRSFVALARGPGLVGVGLEVEGRKIPTVRLADGVVWFTFVDMCDGPRSTTDYIEIARCYHTVMLSDVPILGLDDNDRVRRFINLVDEFYDRNVNLVISAAAEPKDLYPDGRLGKPFQRTVSRLSEMRSHTYLARPHLSD